MYTHSRIILSIAAIALSSTIAGCGGQGIAENAELGSKPLTRTQARIKIFRPNEALASVPGARVKVDGKQIADMDNGGSTIFDVPAGKHQIVVDNWQNPNVYTLNLDAKPGTMYVLEVTAREEAAVAGAIFGLAGMLVEAAANENGGMWRVRIVEEKRIS